MRVSKKSQPGRVSEYGVTPAREPYLNMMATADVRTNEMDVSSLGSFSEACWWEDRQTDWTGARWRFPTRRRSSLGNSAAHT